MISVMKVCKRGCKFKCLLPFEGPQKQVQEKYDDVGYRWLCTTLSSYDLMLKLQKKFSDFRVHKPGTDSTYWGMSRVVYIPLDTPCRRPTA